jgi:hypothetical protein
VPPGGNFNLAVSTTAGVIVPGTYNLTLTGSGGGKTHSQNISVTVQDFGISLSPASQQVLPGAEGDYSVGMTSTSGFSADALFTCSIGGAPAGAACSFDQPDLTPGASTTMRVTTSASTPPGTYAVTITATSGSLVHTGSVNIVIGGADFSLTTSDANPTVLQGGQTRVTITAKSLFGFNSTVSFSCMSGAGVSCLVPVGFIPSPSGTSATVTFKASTLAMVGTRQVTLTATGGGKTHTLIYNLTIE